METKVNNHSIRLTSAEIASLWNTYMNDSAITCVLTHFLETVEDVEIQPLLEQALLLAITHTKAVRELFQMEEMALPHGFSQDQHVVPQAPRLFSDVFYLQFLEHLVKTAMSSHTTALSLATRSDISALFSRFFDEARELHHSIRETMLQKGVYVRAPLLPYPKEVDYVEHNRFLSGWIGRKRPLLAIEAAHLYITNLNNEIGKSLSIGFSQATRDAELRSFYLRGVKISKQILTGIHEIMVESDVPLPSTSDSSVTSSTTSPFSDKLMLYLTNSLSSLGIAMYGSSLAVTMRKDIHTLYAHFIAKAGTYADEGIGYMVERGWLEQPPRFLDREQLAKNGK